MASQASVQAPSDPNGVTGQLANWVHDLQISDIPTDVIERAKHLILDGIACALVSSHLPWSEIAAQGVFSMEGEGPSSVIGWKDKKISPLSAALLNSTFTQGFELDDYHSGAPIHSASVMTPALLAAVELAGSKSDMTDKSIFSGEAFLKAFIIGCEVGPRVGLGLHGEDLLSRGWHSGAIQGPSAAAAGVASLLKMHPREIEWALGTAATQSGGLMSAQFGSMTKRMQHGFAARNGLFAALMARQGYTGIEKVFETPYGGYFSVFGQGAKQDPVPEELVKDLGKTWELQNIRIKLHAAMAALHSTIDAAEKLQKEHPKLFNAENLGNITSITTEHSKAAYEHGGWKLPEEGPLSSTAAQMSIQYAAAAQLMDGQVLMAQYGAAKLNRKPLRDLANKVHPKHNEAFDKSKDDVFKAVMTVTFADGTEVKTTVDAPKGIRPPVSNEDIVDKWRRLVGDVLDDKKRAEIEKCVLSLETAEDVRVLARLLADDILCPIDVSE